jgi:hypothetical protein
MGLFTLPLRAYFHLDAIEGFQVFRGRSPAEAS